MDPKVRQSWEEFLNPDVLRPRLIAASIYIAAFEALKDAIVENIRTFFWCGFDESGDKIDPKYHSDVLSRNRSPVHASLDWLKEMGAINEADLQAFERVKNCRNTLSHRLFDAIGSKGMPTDFEKCFGEMYDLLRKIDVWWIREVEIPTNPDFDGADIDEQGIVSGRELGLHLLCSIALGDEDACRAYFEEFRKRTQGN